MKNLLDVIVSMYRRYNISFSEKNNNNNKLKNDINCGLSQHQFHGSID